MLTFLKLGGSLITDKGQAETARLDVIQRIAREVAEAQDLRPDQRLLIGHGSGSFGHVAAARFGTRDGVQTPDQWGGFAEVARTAARLNTIVIEALADVGLPVMRFQPSASALCENGIIKELASAPISEALAQGVIPVVYGDVAIDHVRGGTIISTEEVFERLALDLRPERILLAGNTPGVFDGRGEVISLITSDSVASHRPALQGSEHTDVTGGMLSKVQGMLSLASKVEKLEIRIFDGESSGNVREALGDTSTNLGTRITR
ncbi:MAG: isopentenyl phosphate kinase family protein [Chloroflexi bacterium]|nr:isopentenyl phosphate kinase family protein [Chloroflexota bacterium]